MRIHFFFAMITPLILPAIATAQEDREDKVSPDLAAIVAHPKLGGISLPDGFKFVEKPGGFCSLYGGIAGPDKLEITYSVWIVPKDGQPRHSGHYTGSHASKILNKKWHKKRYIEGELVELALTKSDLLVVSYPSRGIDLEAEVKNDEQLADALLIMLSLSNKSRQISWSGARVLLEHAKIESIQQTASLGAIIRTSNGINYRTVQPKKDAVKDELKKHGKLDRVFIIHTTTVNAPAPSPEDGAATDEKRDDLYTVKAGSFVAQASQLVTRDGRKRKMLELFEVGRDVDIAIIPNAKPDPNPEMLKWSHELIDDLHLASATKGIGKFTSSGSTVAWGSGRKKVGTVYVIEGTWQGDGERKEFVVAKNGIKPFEISKSVTFEYRRNRFRVTEKVTRVQSSQAKSSP